MCVQVDIFVEDEGEIAENDLVTIKVTLTRNNLPEGGKAQPVYAPQYPLFGEEGWWVLVGDLARKTIFSFERITDSGRVVFKEVNMIFHESKRRVSCSTYRTEKQNKET